MHCIMISVLCVNSYRAFAIVETMASRYAITKHRLYELSAQQLISCEYDPADELDGCQGGALETAFQVLAQVYIGSCL